MKNHALRAAGGWRFLRPDGREFDRIHAEEPPPYSWSDLQEAHDAQSIHIDSRTAATRWRGERIDYELGVWVLCQQRQRADNATDVSAETFDGHADGGGW
ncbi:MAG: hypothetical protein ACLQAR_04800 [Steroidobacteraceae bacterium]